MDARDINPDDAAAAAPYPEEPIRVPLKRPVRLTTLDAKGNATVTEVTEVFVREPTGEDTIAADKGKGEAEKGLRLMAALCDQPFQFAKKLSGWDQARLGEAVARYFPKEV